MDQENKSKFNNKSYILKNPNLFIGDTGATSDSTFSHVILVNMLTAGKEDEIIDVSDNKIQGRILGNMPSVICDNKGKGIDTAIVKYLVYSPKVGFNLFNIIKRLKEGWLLGRNVEVIWITKGNKKIVFYINVETPKDVVFAIFKEKQE